MQVPSTKMTSSRIARLRANGEAERTSTTLRLTPKTMKRQMDRNLVYKTTMTRMRPTLPSSKSKKKRKSNSVRRSRKRERSKRLPRWPVEPSLLRLSVCASRPRLLRKKLVVRQT